MARTYGVFYFLLFCWSFSSLHLSLSPETPLYICWVRCVLTETQRERSNRDGELEKLFYILLHKAEEAKKELSQQDITEIEFTLPHSDEEIYVQIKKEAFNSIIHERIASEGEEVKVNNYKACRVRN
jgi:molecular chaperone DnaK (HSP70)